MNTTFLKNISVCLSALLVSSQVLALEDLDKRISKLETQMNEVSTETALGTYGAKYGTANPSLDSGVFFFGDLLYWHVYEGSAYNLTQNGYVSDIAIFPDEDAEFPTSIDNMYVVNENARNVNFDWDFGFKVGIGYQLPHDDWAATADFTYFRTNGSDTQSGVLPILQGQGNLLPADSPNQFVGLNSTIGNSHTSWKLNFYNINLTLGRNFFISKYLSLQPYAGLQSTWIRQNLTIDSLQTINSAPTNGRFGGRTTIYTLDTENKKKNRFWGIGPRFGFNSKWYFSESGGFYGGVAGGVIWGEFDIENKVENLAVTSSVLEGVINPNSSSEALQTNKTSYHPHRIVANAQLDLGISWEFFFEGSNSQVELKLGYENQYWWRQNYIGVNALGSPDDLGFHGALFEAKFDF